MLDKPKGSWYYKNMSERPSLSLNQAVGVDRPELKPLERSKILNEGGSLKRRRSCGGHRTGLPFRRRPCWTPLEFCRRRSGRLDVGFSLVDKLAEANN
jgi:hypothetical protein